MITLEINGTQYDAFESIKVNRRIDSICGSFQFISPIKDNLEEFPFPLDSSVVVKINETPVITGYIEKFNFNYSATGSDHITISGRDKTADIVDSTLDSSVEYQAPISLKQIVQLVLADIGAFDINVKTNVEIKNFSKDDVINDVTAGIDGILTSQGTVSARYGQNAFKFIEHYARKRQILITTDGQGNVLLIRSSKTPIQTRLINVKNSPHGNIKSASFDRNNSKRYGAYTFRAPPNASAENMDEFTKNFLNGTDVSMSYTVFDTDIRQSRTLNKIASHVATLKDLKERVKWEKEIRRVNSFNYTIKVPEFLAQEDGLIWQPNMLVAIIDDFTGYDDFGLIKSVTYEADTTNGRITTLNIVQKDAYTLEEERPQE